MTENRASRTAREDATRRVLDLPWRDMYEVWRVTGSYLNAGSERRESREEKLLRERAEQLDDLALVAHELKLDKGKWPKVEEYRRVAGELGLRYSTQQIIRPWGYWEEAGEALVGRRRSETPEQRGIRRVTTGRRRTHEELLTSLRDWLATDPAARTTEDYNNWRRVENTRRDGALPYVTATTVSDGLVLPWLQALKVAEFELDLAEAQSRYLAEQRAAAGPFPLIAILSVALIFGVRKPSQIVSRSGTLSRRTSPASKARGSGIAVTSKHSTRARAFRGEHRTSSSHSS